MDYMKNMLIGLFVVVACALIVGIILFLEPTVGDGRETLVARFSNVNGITLGTRVMFAGKPVGEVVAIQQIPHAREQPVDEFGQVYFYQLILHIDSSVRVYNTDEVTVQTSGLLGEKSIAIIPRAPPKGVKPTLITSKTPIYADSVDPLESAFNDLSELSDKVDVTLQKVISWIDQNGHELGSAIRSFDDAMTEASITLKRINQTDFIEEMRACMKSFGETMHDFHLAMEELGEENAFKNLAFTIRHAKEASHSIQQIADKVASGHGTIGKLLMDDETYLRFTAILSKVDTMMNDLNHYGLLFNLNKEWQRTRLKQVTLLNALNTPEAFRDYFNQEVDLINTSMARLSMLIKRAETSSESERILDSQAFQKDFAELMRRSEALSDNLRLYNEQFLSEQKLAK